VGAQCRKPRGVFPTWTVEDHNDVGAQCRKPRGVFRARGSC
jgi:hypothetical protein